MEATPPSLAEFTDSARREFKFLVEDFGFGEASPLAKQYQNPFEAHFERAGWRIIVEGLSYDFCAGVSIRDPDGRQAFFGHIVPRDFFWAHRDGLGRGQLGDIRYCALTLRTFGSEFLRGDTQIFDELLRRQAAYIEADHREMKAWDYRIASPRAARAFALKDYNAVISFLSPHLEHLTDVEHQKLDYARRHSKAPET